MRNLLEYPISRDEAYQCLKKAADNAVADDEMAMRVGNLDSYILMCAANLCAQVDRTTFLNAFCITDDSSNDPKPGED